MIPKDDIEAMLIIWTALGCSWADILKVMADVAEAKGRQDVVDALKHAVEELEGR